MGLRERVAEHLQLPLTVSRPHHDLEGARQFLETFNHRVVSLKEFERLFRIKDFSTPPGFFSSYYRPEDPRQIKKNKAAMDKFLETPAPKQTLSERIRGFWR